jgi:mRNA-degrading endonuclease RelE of RelBE toxin-antitoxin system
MGIGEPMRFRIVLTPAAEVDLAYYKAHDRGVILDAIRIHLETEPLVESKRRKRLEENLLAPWELRVGDHRVFYGVEEVGTVMISAIGHKEHNDLIIRGKKVEL